MTSKLKASAAGFVLIMATIFVAPMASAKTLVTISGQHTSNEIKTKCQEAGGRYFEGDHTFGCNNDKKGTEVICDKGNLKCHGYVPISGANKVLQLSEILVAPQLATQPKPPTTSGSINKTPQGSATTTNPTNPSPTKANPRTTNPSTP